MTADGFCDYCKGNIIKYIWRWRDKGGVEDLRKASVYLDWLINAAEGKENDCGRSKILSGSDGLSKSVQTSYQRRPHP